MSHPTPILLLPQPRAKAARRDKLMKTNKTQHAQSDKLSVDYSRANKKTRVHSHSRLRFDVTS